MPTYSFSAIASDGQRVSGQIDAPRVSDAIAELEARGLDVESIRAVVPTVDHSAVRKAFYERVTQALAQRDDLIPALNAIADEIPEANAARDLRRLVDVLNGNPTAEQIMQRPDIASWLPVIVRGAAAPSTANRYERMIEEANRESENRKSLRRFLAYPLCLIFFSGLVLLFLLLTVVPVFAKMFSEFGLRLPAPTALLFLLHDQLTLFLPRTLVISAVAVLIVVVVTRVWLHFALSTSLLGMFTAGNSANVTAMARFTGSLAELLSIEAPLPEALRISGQVCKHRHFQVMAERLANQIQFDGIAINQSPIAHNFPSTMILAISSSASKPNIPLLRELSRMYSERARARIGWTTSFLGPISLFAVGILVGFVVIALFMPLVSLVTSLA